MNFKFNNNSDLEIFNSFVIKYYNMIPVTGRNNKTALNFIKMSGIIEKVNNIGYFMTLMTNHEILKMDETIYVARYNGIQIFVSNNDIMKDKIDELYIMKPNDIVGKHLELYKSLPANFMLLSNESSKSIITELIYIL